MKKGIAAALLALVFFAAAAPAGVSYLAWMKIRKPGGIGVKGSFVPRWGSWSFEVREVNLDWQDRIRVTGGDLTVRYDPATLFAPGGLEVGIEGEDLPVELAEGFAVMAGKSEMRLDYLNALFILDRQGLKEVKGLDARAGVFQFRFGETENSKEGAAPLQETAR